MPQLNFRHFFILIIIAFFTASCGVKNYSRFSYNKEYQQTNVIEDDDSEKNNSSVAGYYYTVQKDDTLWHISQITGVVIDAIKKANKLADANKLYKGLTLYIPKMHDPYAKFTWPAKGAIY